MKIENKSLEYESVSYDLQSLSVLVGALGTDEVITLSNKNIRDNCFELISQMISDKAKLVDKMFEDYCKK